MLARTPWLATAATVPGPVSLKDGTTAMFLGSGEPFGIATRFVETLQPKSILDVGTGGEIVDLMFELNRESNTTLVLVTHDETLSQRCQRRLRLASGRLVADERR